MKHYTIDNCPAHIRNYVFQSEEYKKLQDELTRLDMFKKFFDVRLYNIILSKYIWQGRVPNSYYNTSHGPRTWKPPRPWYDTDKKLPWGVRYGKPKNPFIGLKEYQGEGSVHTEGSNRKNKKCHELNREFRRIAKSIGLDYRFKMKGSDIEIILEDWEEVWAAINLTTTN
jgi:hypothetical protein